MKEQGDPQTGGAETADLNPPPITQHRILVVDDEPELRRMSAEALIQSGYHVDAAEDGEIAWDTLQVSSYDVVVTDNTMPKMSGVELLKRLRAARLAPPVIMASGAMPSDIFEQYPWLKPTAMLQKPYTVAELLGTVKKVLQSSETALDQPCAPPDRQSPPSADGPRL